MANRTRPIRIEFCVSENEHRIIKSKMAQLGTKNMGAYLRKMAIDGYIIKVDYTQQKKLAAAVSRAYTVNSIIDCSLGEYTKEMIPWLATFLIAMAILAFFPAQIGRASCRERV